MNSALCKRNVMQREWKKCTKFTRVAREMASMMEFNQVFLLQSKRVQMVQ
jgi:hypothetical protein